METKMSCFLLLLLVHAVLLANGKRMNILLVSTPFTGHANRVLAIGEVLATRGHNVTFCSLDNWVNLKEQAIERGINYMSAGEHGVTRQQWVDLILQRSKINGFSSQNPFGIIKELRLLSESSPMSGTDSIAVFLMSLNLSQWDIVVTEHYLLHRVPCIAKSRNIPIVTLVDMYYSNESPSWVYPIYLSGHSHDMNFKQRLLTGISTIGWRLLSLLSLQWYILGSPITESLCKDNFKYPIELGWEIPMIISTVIGLEYPRTIPPLATYVGPILSQQKSASPLPMELHKWLENKRDKSVIFISMGSQIMISSNLARSFINGIDTANYSVVWSLNAWSKDLLYDELSSINNSRYYISEWIPQIDVFQHKSLMMAILHGGSNGIHESLYYGIPIIVIPNGGDQFDWATRVHSARVGIQILHNVSSYTISDSIAKIADKGEGYQERAQFMSVLMKRGGGVDRASDLIEFYGTYGYEHLIPAPVKYQWSWIVYYNIDVYLILVLCCIVLPLVCCVWCYGHCCFRQHNKKKKND